MQTDKQGCKLFEIGYNSKGSFKVKETLKEASRSFKGRLKGLKGELKERLKGRQGKDFFVLAFVETA